MQQGPIYSSTYYVILLSNALGQSLLLGNASPFLSLLDQNATVQCLNATNSDVAHVLLYLSELSHMEKISPIFEQFLLDPRVDPSVVPGTAISSWDSH